MTAAARGDCGAADEAAVTLGERDPTHVVSTALLPAYGFAMIALPALLAPLLALAAPPTAEQRALTTWLAEAAATTPGAEVVTTADVNQLLQLQGEKQVRGCDDDSEACAAEIASALGAELVVRSELGSLEGDRTLNVTVLNTNRLGATRRALWQASSTSGLGEKARAELPGLIGAARSTPGAVRIFVVDVVTVEGDGRAVEGGPSGTPWQVPVGGTVVGVGVLGLGVATVAEVMVLGMNGELAKTGAEALDQPTASSTAASRGTWALAGQVGWIVGGAGVVVGGAVLALGLMGGE
jgi:hypothetical protein